MHHHELLSSESVAAHSSALLAIVRHFDVPAVQLRCRLRSDRLRSENGSDNRVAVVPSAEGLLLCNSGSWLRDHSFAGDHADSPAHSVSHTATHTATHATANSTRDSAPDSASCTTPPTHAAPSTSRACRSVQLRGGILPRLGWSQADLVLQPSSYLRSADGTTTPSRSLQLRGWICKLAGGLVCGQEGVVLQSSWKGLPESRRRLCHGRTDCAHRGAVRLRGGVRELDGRLVCGQEGLVLFEQGQGLPTGRWRVRLSFDLLSG